MIEMTASTAGSTGTDRLVEVVLDGQGTGASGSAEQTRDREQAIAELRIDSFFSVAGHTGPFALYLSMQERRLVFDIRDERHRPLYAFGLALSRFRSIIKDYGTLIETYNIAMTERTADQIQAIDMGRRSLHNEGADLVMERLAGKVEIEFETARRLFTLICLL